MCEEEEEEGGKGREGKGGREERREGVPSARSIDRQQRTAAALGSRRISLHCD